MTECEDEECGNLLEPCSYNYCAVCLKDLCVACMAKGHCGNVPAKSGSEADALDKPR